MKSCKEKSNEWGITVRAVNELCKKGKISGAVKTGKSWQIPDDAEKPADGRIVSGRYVRKAEPEDKKPLPVGISDYVRAQSEYYYVDKTLLIEEINRTIGRKNKLTCISRPRRFGKSYAARMLCAYYDRSCDSHTLFENLKIANDSSYEDHINQYHVIYLDMTQVLGDAGKNKFIDFW